VLSVNAQNNSRAQQHTSNSTEEAGSKAAKQQKSTTELSFIENNGSTAHQLLAHSRNEGMRASLVRVTSLILLAMSAREGRCHK
jgi:hypothetical protein